MPVEKSRALPAPCNGGVWPCYGLGGSASSGFSSRFPKACPLYPPHGRLPVGPCSFSASTACHTLLPGSAMQAPRALLCFCCFCSAPVTRRGHFLLVSVQKNTAQKPYLETDTHSFPARCLLSPRAEQGVRKMHLHLMRAESAAVTRRTK